MLTCNINDKTSNLNSSGHCGESFILTLGNFGDLLLPFQEIPVPGFSLTFGQ